MYTAHMMEAAMDDDGIGLHTPAEIEAAQKADRRTKRVVRTVLTICVGLLLYSNPDAIQIRRRDLLTLGKRVLETRSVLTKLPNTERDWSVVHSQDGMQGSNGRSKLSPGVSPTRAGSDAIRALQSKLQDGTPCVTTFDLGERARRDLPPAILLQTNTLLISPEIIDAVGPRLRVDEGGEGVCKRSRVRRRGEVQVRHLSDAGTSGTIWLKGDEALCVQYALDVMNGSCDVSKLAKSHIEL